jgi:hypothetical protein
VAIRESPTLAEKVKLMPAVNLKPSGPKGAKRPFAPLVMETDPAVRAAYALEHIAVLSAIDTNIQGILRELEKGSS